MRYSRGCIFCYQQANFTSFCRSWPFCSPTSCTKLPRSWPDFLLLVILWNLNFIKYQRVYSGASKKVCLQETVYLIRPWLTVGSTYSALHKLSNDTWTEQNDNRTVSIKKMCCDRVNVNETAFCNGFWDSFYLLMSTRSLFWHFSSVIKVTPVSLHWSQTVHLVLMPCQLYVCYISFST